MIQISSRCAITRELLPSLNILNMCLLLFLTVSDNGNLGKGLFILKFHIPYLVPLPSANWSKFWSRQLCVTGFFTLLFGHNLNSNHPLWLAVTSTDIFIGCPFLYLAEIIPVAYLPPASFSRFWSYGSPQIPHFPPFLPHWYWNDNRNQDKNCLLYIQLL